MSLINDKSYDDLDIARQNIEFGYSDYVINTIDTIITYVWPVLFEENTHTKALEVMNLALEHIDKYPEVSSLKHQNVCPGFYSKLAWHYTVYKAKEPDYMYDNLYNLLLNKGWHPSKEDKLVVVHLHDPQVKKKFASLLGGKSNEHI